MSEATVASLRNLGAKRPAPPRKAPPRLTGLAGSCGWERVEVQRLRGHVLLQRVAQAQAPQRLPRAVRGQVGGSPAPGDTPHPGRPLPGPRLGLSSSAWNQSSAQGALSLAKGTVRARRWEGPRSWGGQGLPVGQSPEPLPLRPRLGVTDPVLREGPFGLQKRFDARLLV